MGLFDYFKKKEEAQPVVEDPKNLLPEVSEDKFIDNSDPTSQETATNDYGSRLPIDTIYGFLREDYEHKAYNDAITSPDRSYKETNIAIIRSNLEVQFKQVQLKYEDMLRDIDFHIKSRSEAGLTDIVDLLKSKKETYQKHVEEIKSMKKDLESEELYMIGIFKSYEVGFTRGLASLSLHNLKIDNEL